ncbi:MAG: hypothetical protein CW716_02950 [Candidatus Bathyarchaeum sp.]|nr:MAG: hypothetical protein CW716_02950 [Candidatus Bathyarchaeum sp.]
MKGKPWPKEDADKLVELVDAKKPLDVIVSQFQGRSEGAIKQKIRRLGLEVVVSTQRIGTTTSELKIPKDLPSVEEALKILAAALKRAAQEGLDKVEVQRLNVVATLARTYKELFADYVHYREIEAKLVELEVKYAKLAKT